MDGASSEDRQQVLAMVMDASSLSERAKTLFTKLYAVAGPDGRAVVSEVDLAVQMGIGLACLRRYRSELNEAGYCRVHMDDGDVYFKLRPLPAMAVRAPVCSPARASVQKPPHTPQGGWVN